MNWIKKNKLPIAFSCIALFVMACSNVQKTIRYTDTHPALSNRPPIGVLAIIGPDTTTIQSQPILDSIPQLINSANYDGIWKTPFWDELQLIYPDTTLRFNSNGFVFSPKGSLFFYELPVALQRLWFEEY